MSRSSGPRDPSSYEVGFGKPPVATRIQPGERRNPHGRPKGSRSIGAMVNEALEQTIVVVEGGKSRRMRAFQVMLRRLRNDALSGNLRAIAFLLSLRDRYGGSPETALDMEALSAEDR